MKKTLLFGFTFFWVIYVKSQDCPECLHKTDISGQWFINYQYNNSEKYGRFNLKRGYFTFQTRLNDLLSVRYTQDITLDTEGDDAGNIEIRMKYLYLKLLLNDWGIIRKPFVEFGMVHRPWLSFEESISMYRVQSTMFAETAGLISSADLGVYFSANLGEKLEPEIAAKLQEKTGGQYGSFAIGIYNGGGYNAYELNGNKTLECRFSLRPFYFALPGLQISYSGAFGQMNLPDFKAPFVFNLFMLSYKSSYLTGSLQYYFGQGSNGDAYVDFENNSSHRNEGSSYFLELKHPKLPLSLMSRFDYINSYASARINSQNYFGGIAYHFLKNKVFVGFHKSIKSQLQSIITGELALEIKF